MVGGTDWLLYGGNSQWEETNRQVAPKDDTLGGGGGNRGRGRFVSTSCFFSHNVFSNCDRLHSEKVRTHSFKKKRPLSIHESPLQQEGGGGVASTVKA